MNSVKPTYYKAMWHNCVRCKIHYMSEEPHLKAYLCDECWTTIPHYKPQQRKKKEMKPKGTIPAEAWILFYMTVGSLLLIWVAFNLMLNEL
tara:strand:- start:103 stop:375 length:273 start_codon:yes stop_codon:yes gene_type:complete